MSRRPPGRGWLWAVDAGLLLLCAACSSDPADGRDFTLRDSADVVIVESGRPALGPDAWTVPGEPLVSIGGAEAEVLLHPTDAIRRDDGRIVVADEQGHRLTFFSPTGDLVRRVGRQGEGPGEFQSPSTVDRFRGDSLMVYDHTRRQVSILAPDGSFGRSLPVRFGPNYWAGGVVQDSLVFLWSPGEGRPRRDRTGMYWDSTWLALYRGPELRVDTIGRFPLSERRGLRAGIPRPYHFEHRMSFALANDRFYLGFSQAYEIGEFTLDGDLVRLVRRPFDREPVTEDLKNRFREGYIRLIETEEGRVTPEQIEDLLQYVEQADYPEFLPAYSEMLLDEAGNLWVEDYRIFTDPRSTWTVFDPQGQWLTTVQTPEGLRLSEIGADYVLGLSPDDMGAQRVQLHPLVKPATRGLSERR